MTHTSGDRAERHYRAVDRGGEADFPMSGRGRLSRFDFPEQAGFITENWRFGLRSLSGQTHLRKTYGENQLIAPWTH